MLDEYALCHFLALGTRPSVLLPVFVFVWSCVTYSERRTDPESWLVDSWCLVQGRVRADWNNQSLLFHCPLFHWCLVWRVSGYVACMCRSCKPWIYRVDIIRLPIIKSQGPTERWQPLGSSVKKNWAWLGENMLVSIQTAPVAAFRSVFDQPKGACTLTGIQQHLSPTALWWQCTGRWKWYNMVPKVL